MERLADLRSAIHTLDDARRAFDALAMNTIKLAALDAAAEKRIAKIKLDHEAATAETRAATVESGKLLSHFIAQNKALFDDPRKIKTNLGSFGLQAVNELIIEDEETLKKYLVTREMKDCFEPVFKLLKNAIQKHIRAGKKIPGARIHSGDTAVYKVEKSLIDQAKKEAV